VVGRVCSSASRRRRLGVYHMERIMGTGAYITACVFVAFHPPSHPDPHLRLLPIG
jgi:hypothetical protein